MQIERPKSGVKLKHHANPKSEIARGCNRGARAGVCLNVGDWMPAFLV
jgi:hypothetical protein